MKKSLFLFTVMLASFLASFTNAWADTDPSAEFKVTPSDGTASYEYYVRLSRKFSNSSDDKVGRFYLQKKLGSDSNNLLFSSTEDKLIVTLKEFSNSDGQFYVVPTNAVTAEGTATNGIFVTEATSLGTKILLKSTSASTSNTQGWYIQARNKSSYFSSGYACWDIIEHVYTISVGNSDNSQGWNIHWPLDNGTTVELYQNNDGNCALYFEPANATAVKAALQEQIDKAESYLGTVGYPSETSTEGTALKAAIENINNFDSATSDFATVKAALTTALEKYEASTDIKLPEDGKVYKIAAVFDDESEYALYYNPNGKMYNDNDLISSTGCIDGVEGVDNVDKSGYFFCHEVKVGENKKYLFVNKDGYYLTWLDPNASTSSKYHTGYTDSYESQKNLWTISKAASSGSHIASTTTAANVFGKVQMQAIGDGSSTYYLLARIPGRGSSDGNTMDFVSGGSSDIYYDNYTSGSTTVRRTHAFKFYEVSVDDYCTLNLKAAYSDNTTENCYLATYSTPFPVTIPDNMEAYYAPSYADGQSNVSLQKIDGTIIPKGTGVVVKSPTAGKFNPVPATENGTTPSANALQPTGGNGKTVESGTKAYILINANPARFNLLTSDTNNRTIAPFRAYLVPNTTESDTPQQAVGISFGSTLSGITSATNQNDTVNSPVYDLSGRIVKQPVRGIYIKNGKKFIVK